MKKIFALAFSVILTLSLVACGEKTTKMKDDIKNDIKDGVSNIESVADGLVGNKDTVGSTAKITADEAKAAAFKHAGVNENDVTGIDVDLDRDDRVLKYEVDFYSGGVEYDYDINAETGDIISADKDMD